MSEGATPSLPNGIPPWRDIPTREDERAAAIRRADVRRAAEAASRLAMADLLVAAFGALATFGYTVSWLAEPADHWLGNVAHLAGLLLAVAGCALLLRAALRMAAASEALQERAAGWVALAGGGAMVLAAALEVIFLLRQYDGDWSALPMLRVRFGLAVNDSILGLPPFIAALLHLRCLWRYGPTWRAADDAPVAGA